MRRGSLLGDCGCRRQELLGDGDGLGDFFCTVPEQRAAEAAMLRMNTLFASMGKPVKYAALVDAINKQWDTYDHWYRDFTTCGAKETGQKAEELANQMASEAGLATMQDPELKPGMTGEIGDAIKKVVNGLIIVGGIGGGLYVADRFLISKRRP